MPVRFQWIPITGAWAVVVEALSIIGVGVVLGIMAFGFFGRNVAVIVGVLATAVMIPLGFGFLRDYEVLAGSLVAYAVSFLVCYLLSFRSKQDFDFDTIRHVTGDFDHEDPVTAAAGSTDGAGATGSPFGR